MVAAPSRIREKSLNASYPSQHSPSSIEALEMELEGYERRMRRSEHYRISGKRRDQCRRLILTGTGNMQTAFLQMEKSSHRVIEDRALRDFSAPLKFLDSIANRLLGCGHSIQQDPAVRLKQCSHIQLFPRGQRTIQLHQKPALRMSGDFLKLTPSESNCK